MPVAFTIFDSMLAPFVSRLYTTPMSSLQWHLRVDGLYFGKDICLLIFQEVSVGCELIHGKLPEVLIPLELYYIFLPHLLSSLWPNQCLPVFIFLLGHP